MRTKIALIDDFSSYSYNLIYGGLLKEKIDVIFYGPQRPLNKRYSENELFQNPKRVWTSYLYPIQIFKQAVLDRPNIVHIQHELNTFGTFNTNLLLPFLLLLLRTRRSKIVMTEHSILAGKELGMVLLFPASKELGRLALTVFYILIGKLVDLIVVHDPAFKSSLVEHYKIPEDKIRVIPHGVPSEKLATRKFISDELVRPLKGKVVVLYFGVLSPRKGLEYLLSAFEKVRQQNKESMLVIAGEEPVYYEGYKKKLQSMVNQLGIWNNVLFTGFICNGDVHAIFRLSEVVVFPYVFSASASGPLSIAIQHHKPIIATKTQYFVNVLDDGEDALLVSPRNDEELAEAIITLLRDETLRKRFSINIGEKAKRFSWARIAKMTADLYAKLLGLPSDAKGKWQ